MFAGHEAKHEAKPVAELKAKHAANEAPKFVCAYITLRAEACSTTGCNVHQTDCRNKHVALVTLRT